MSERSLIYYTPFHGGCQEERGAHSWVAPEAQAEPVRSRGFLDPSCKIVRRIHPFFISCLCLSIQCLAKISHSSRLRKLRTLIIKLAMPNATRATTCGVMSVTVAPLSIMLRIADI